MLALSGFVLGFVASVAANIVAVDLSAVDPVWVRRVLAAWPPVLLFVAYETLASDHAEPLQVSTPVGRGASSQRVSSTSGARRHCL
jgi:hypothetical protein